ncbi:unnamed protein product, partial [Prorocentrum cordatum]
AEPAKKQTAQVLANHKSPSPPTPTATSTGGKPFGFSYDKQLFDNLEDLECEETERTELNKAHQQLIETQKYFDGEAEKCTAFIKKATEMRADITARIAKKRRGGAAMTPASPSGPADQECK